ncbi:MAG: hypothetical protein LWW85_13125, partial [Marinilabiliales bacterium]|nr:hypothetical protein [Marinilabiliales bacterium]
MKKTIVSLLLLTFFCHIDLIGQKVNDSNAPLHLMAPAYDTPYGRPDERSIKELLDRIGQYLERVTPMAVIDGVSKQEISDLSKIDEKSILQPGDFRLTSYEWGVTYAGMLLAGRVTGDTRFTQYTLSRLKFLAAVSEAFLKLEQQKPGIRYGFYRTNHPQALDDCGAICAAMLKAADKEPSVAWQPLIQRYIQYISE